MTPSLVVCIVCESSVSRALLSSLLGSSGADVHPFDTIPRALTGMVGIEPDVVILEAQLARGNPDTIPRLRDAWRSAVGIVLADRGYSDDRRAYEESRALGASAFIAIPPEPAALA